MIPTHRRPSEPQYVRREGQPEIWTPRPSRPGSLPIGRFALGKAASHAFAAPSLGTPDFLTLEEWTLGKAASHPIGWFDSSLLDKILENPPGEGGEGMGAGAPLPPKDDIARRLAAVLQPPLDTLCAPNGVLEWPSPLLNYQREGISMLLARRELLLADDMGLGKTIQTIAAIRILAFQQQIETALVVCPASLLAQWRRELTHWAPDLRVIPIAGGPAERGALWRVPAHVKLISYETLRADVLDLYDSPVLRIDWDVVALDEASRIKNSESGIAIACKRLRRKRRWAITGTPLENRMEDVLSLFEFLTAEPGTRYHAPQGMSAIRAELRRLQLRRKKEDVLADLPPKQVNELIVELPPEQQVAYDRAEQDGVMQLTQSGAEITITHVLELISRLKQLCNFDPVSQQSAKLADIAQRLRTLVAEGHRALIFSQFTDSTFGVARAADYLKEFAPLVYTGSLSAGQKADVVERFLSDTRRKALLLSLRAGGVGLNLQAASYVFHLDRWWNPAIEEQADSRAHRMGQRYPVTVFRYICANTIEERIDRKLKEKRKLFHDIVDDVSLDLATALTEVEIFGLFGMNPPPSAPRPKEKPRS